MNLAPPIRFLNSQFSDNLQIWGLNLQLFTICPEAIGQSRGLREFPLFSPKTYFKLNDQRECLQIRVLNLQLFTINLQLFAIILKMFAQSWGAIFMYVNFTPVWTNEFLDGKSLK